MSRPPKAAGFLVSLLVHAALLAALLLSGALPAGGCRTRQPTLEIPIGFLVEEAPDSGAEPTPPEPTPPEPPPPEPEPEPEPDVPAPPPPKPEPKPEKKPDPPKKHEVKVNKTKVIKRDTPTPPTRKPIPSNWKKLNPNDFREKPSTPRVGVPGGSPTGSPTAQANEDNLVCARIKTTLENAWVQPTYEDRGSRPVTIRLDFRADGSFDVALHESSGSAVMDRSILDAARGVRRFSFLPRDFIRRNPAILIDFKLTSAP